MRFESCHDLSPSSDGRIDLSIRGENKCLMEFNPAVAKQYRRVARDCGESRSMGCQSVESLLRSNMFQGTERDS